jgi:hypothetical protein
LTMRKTEVLPSPRAPWRATTSPAASCRAATVRAIRWAKPRWRSRGGEAAVAKPRWRSRGGQAVQPHQGATARRARGRRVGLPSQGPPHLSRASGSARTDRLQPPR